MEIIHSAESQVQAGKALTELLNLNSEKSVLLMLSGGSAWSLLDFVQSEVLGPHVTMCVLDERFSTDPIINNFALLQTTEFYIKAQAAGVKVISTLVNEGDEILEVKGKFELALKDWRENNPDGEIITTMGIGADGHTAGIMAGDYGVDFTGEDWVVAYEVPESVNPYSKRVTVSHTFLLNQIDEAVVFVVGEEKKKYVDLLEADECEVDVYPTCILSKMKSVQIYTDLN